ncbi:MAG TPA: hypothetical protein VG942_16330, partial [Hyphomonadaceae bacterium]|nr:hypothetical protein [Hyphomonadaceae bacterium]
MRMGRAGIAGVSLMFAAACSPQQDHKQAVAPAAVATPAAPAAAMQSADQGPPTVNGVYVDKGACPGEGCYLKGKIKAYEAVDLFDKPDGAVIGKLAVNEWVEIVNRENHLIPRRGVVRTAAKHFAAGDVVYLLTSEGEGCFQTWSKGAVGSWCDPESVGEPETNETIELDQAAGDGAA